MTAQQTDTDSTTLTKWAIDPAHTQVSFTVKHMMFAKVRGQFGTLEGDIVFSEGSPADSSARAVIQAASIDTGNDDRDEHLRSGDFLDAETYPELTFESRSVTRTDDGYAVSGELTIRDATRTVELDVRETGRGEDPWGQQRVGFSATTTIDRRDFGLTWNQALEAGGVLVGNDVSIAIEVQAILQD